MKEETIRISELDIEVEDVGEFEDEAGEILTAFCQDLEDQGEVSPLEEDDELAKHEGWSFIWTSKASTLIRDKIDELAKIGAKYFPDEVFDISSHMFVEP